MWNTKTQIIYKIQCGIQKKNKSKRKDLDNDDIPISGNYKKDNPVDKITPVIHKI